MNEKEKTDLALNVINEYARSANVGIYLKNELFNAANEVLLKALQSDT